MMQPNLWKEAIMIQIKRVYDPPAQTDGMRILVERLWPRGIKKEALKLDDWRKDAAPSTELRKWFSQIPVPSFQIPCSAIIRICSQD